MPTFTAIALDRLLEPGTSKSVDMPGPNSKPPIPNSNHSPNRKIERRRNATNVDKKVIRPQMSPALYTTPESTPLPDSPTSFSPSPYIINHKRRGPRLLKSFSEFDVQARKKDLEEVKVNGNGKLAETKSADLPRSGSVTFTIAEPGGEENENGFHNDPVKEENSNAACGGSVQVLYKDDTHDGALGTSNGEIEVGSSCNGLATENDAPKLVPPNLDRIGDGDDFFDLQETMSFTSNTEGEDYVGAESSGRFYDASEELSEGGQQSSLRDVEAELRGIRLSLLMEIEKRKQAEEAANVVHSNWQRMVQQLALVGLTLPADPTDVAQDQLDPAEELCHQVNIARFVSESVGRGIARAEMEKEMEAQLELKNFEIARLMDRLHYYEVVNGEMSQRNQEAVEMARRDRLRRRKRQRWVWGSIAAAITLGTAALAWSYLPSGKGSSHTDQDAPNDDAATK